nr:unnamed protein product [Spirometra erinaceieuropaei]
MLFYADNLGAADEEILDPFEQFAADAHYSQLVQETLIHSLLPITWYDLYHGCKRPLLVFSFTFLLVPKGDSNVAWQMNVCTFSFSRTYAPNVVVSCEDFVCIPRDQPLTWLLSRLILTHGIPKFAEADFSDALQVFIEEEEKKFYDKSASKLYDEFIADDSNGERIAAELETAVDERTTSRRQLESLADEEIFGQAYARIVQNVEETAALITKGGSNEAVSELQRRFHADYEILKTQWDSRISELKELQRRNYRSFVMSVEEQLPQSVPRTSPSDAVRRGSAPSSRDKRPGATPPRTSREPTKPSQHLSTIHAQSSPHEPRSESFMVELGRQLRTSYNLKLIQADPLNLITIVGSGLSGPPESTVSPTTRTANLAERLSSALTIYSNQLTGLIILVNSQFFQSRDQRRLAEICERSTDFHFPEYDHQLAEIQDTINHLLAAGVRSGESSAGEERPAADQG